MKKVMLILMLAVWLAIAITWGTDATVGLELDPNELSVYLDWGGYDPNTLFTVDESTMYYDISIAVGDGEILFTTTDDGKMDIIFDANDCTANVKAFVDCMETMMSGYILSMAEKLIGEKESNKF